MNATMRWIWVMGLKSLAAGALCGVVIGCGGSADTPAARSETIRGKIIDGYISGALVCIDTSANSRCDEGEPRAISDAAGAYELNVPGDSLSPLIAEIKAGQARDSDEPGAPIGSSYRMASPSKSYSKNITPFTTLVHVSGERDFALAEDMVRNELGLPPKFNLAMDAAPEAGSLKHSVAKSIVVALKATDATLDMAAVGAMKTVVAAFPASLTDLPALWIATKNSVPITSKEVYVDATFRLLNPALSSEVFNLNGKIRGRGHSTWGQPKNPYKVQFSNDAAYARVPDFLGMPKNRNWALLADYFDRSLIRNKLALSLGGSSVFSDGLKWTPSGQHLEVWLNGDYVGVYLLTEDIRIDAARLNIRKMSSKASANEVDGGYIVEVDARLDCFNDGVVNLQMILPNGAPVCVDKPDEEDITPAQLAYVKGFLHDLDTELFQASRIERLNAASFADWYLLQELFRNVDANFYSSDFMWKDSETAATPQDRLLNMGPIWDFDRSAGNDDEYEAWKTAGCWVAKPDVRFSGRGNWFSRLFDNSDFLGLTIARWQAKRPALERYLDASIDTFSRRLGQAKERNFDAWPVFGVPLTSHYVFSNHAEEVAFVRMFLEVRMAWLDMAFASPKAFADHCSWRGHPVIGPT